MLTKNKKQLLIRGLNMARFVRIRQVESRSKLSFGRTLRLASDLYRYINHYN